MMSSVGRNGRDRDTRRLSTSATKSNTEAGIQRVRAIMRRKLRSRVCTRATKWYLKVEPRFARKRKMFPGLTLLRNSFYIPRSICVTDRVCEEICKPGAPALLRGPLVFLILSHHSHVTMQTAYVPIIVLVSLRYRYLPMYPVLFMTIHTVV
jgi:hypothetical protein